MNAARAVVPGIDTTTELAPASDGVLIVDASFRPVALDSGAEEIFGSLLGHSNANGDIGVPQQILTLLQTRSLQRDDDSPLCLSAGGHHYTCRAFLLRPRGGAEPMITLYLRREVSLVDAVHQIAVDYRLTDREEEALIGLAMGLSSKELAVRMKISPNTVKAFVRLAMIKMGASSRARLVAKLIDRQTG
jgi:DNA-binding CsgD family transcriptional regulator